MSLGVTPAHVLKLVMAKGMKLAACRFVIGTVAAFSSRRLMASLLTMIQAGDPAIYVIAPLVLITVAVLACSIPAARASRINPIIALRNE